MSDALDRIALAISSMLFASLWEGAIIVAAVWLLMRAVPKLGASTRYAVWLTALSMLIIAPLCTMLIPDRHETQAMSSSRGAKAFAGSNVIVNAHVAAPQSGRHASSSAAASSPALPRRIDIPLDLSAGIAMLWVLALAARLGVLVVHLRRLHTLRRSAVPLCTDFGYTVLTSRSTSVPLAIGFMRPAVVLPASLSEEISVPALEAIVMHEVAHLRRYDVWTNALARVLEALLAPNPFAWLVTARLSVEREIACDDWVVARLDAGEVFANALATLVCRPAFHSIAAPSAIGSKHSIVTRIEQLLDRRPRRLRPSAVTLTSTLLLLTLFAMVVPSFSPVLALAAQPSTSPNAAGCNHAPLVEGIDTNMKPTGRWAPLTSHNGNAKDPKNTVIDVTIDAAGKLSKTAVVSSPHARDAAAAKRFLAMMKYRPAVSDCKAKASTVRLVLDINIAAPAPISIVRADYPYGWSSEHPRACRVPDLLHGGVPAVQLVNNKTETASVLVRVDPNGRVRSATLTKASGNTTYDNAVLAAARSDTYPLNETTGFKPVRPDGAPTSWNATHGYSLYSKCAPLPAEYTWTTTFPPADSPER